MTTEIAIMNKSAVALAADSAVTITVPDPKGDNYKIFNSANKLFALSKYAPVGLMIYGNANLLGIPWETLIKTYRKYLGDTEFPSLVDYSTDFFKFLDGFDIGTELEQTYLAGGAQALFEESKSKLDDWVKSEIANGKSVDEIQIRDQLAKIIESQHHNFINYSNTSAHSKSKRALIKKKHQAFLDKVISSVFHQRPLSARSRSQLHSIAVNAASIGPSNQSGIVLAGFGTKDLYPHCQNYDVAAIFEGKTIKRDGKQKQSITHKIGAAIIPFAQSDEVHTFMRGIGPVLSDFLTKTFYEIMASGLPDQLRDEISNKFGLSSVDQKNELRKIASDMCKGACDYAFQKFNEEQSRNYIQPVVNATEFLNKGELAAMAETLVNLVSFRKQVTMEAETVGGPIDVAVITKGDGLVWIKRKYYFKPDLNHHYFSNYYRKDGCNV